MAVLQVNLLSILVAFAVLVDVNGNISFEPRNPQDPANIGLVRQALTTLGIDPDGIRLDSFYKKWWFLGFSYKATYSDKEGRTCYLAFYWKSMHGLRVDDTPRCNYDCRGDACGKCDVCRYGDGQSGEELDEDYSSSRESRMQGELEVKISSESKTRKRRRRRRRD